MTPDPKAPGPALDREGIARAVSPGAWDDGQFAEPGGTGQRYLQNAAYEAADRILALAAGEGDRRERIVRVLEDCISARALPHTRTGGGEMVIDGIEEAADHIIADDPAPRSGGDDDPPCADCGGSGVSFQTERRCACQPVQAQEGET